MTSHVSSGSSTVVPAKVLNAEVMTCNLPKILLFDADKEWYQVSAVHEWHARDEEPVPCTV